MVWFVLESTAMPGSWFLQSKEKWDGLVPDKENWFNVIKKCATEEEANAVLDELRKKAEAARKR
jgi:hypothetical protein